MRGGRRASYKGKSPKNFGRYRSPRQPEDQDPSEAGDQDTAPLFIEDRKGEPSTGGPKNKRAGKIRYSRDVAYDSEAHGEDDQEPEQRPTVSAIEVTRIPSLARHIAPIDKLDNVEEGVSQISLRPPRRKGKQPRQRNQQQQLRIHDDGQQDQISSTEDEALRDYMENVMQGLESGDELAAGTWMGPEQHTYRSATSEEEDSDSDADEDSDLSDGSDLETSSDASVEFEFDEDDEHVMDEEAKFLGSLRKRHQKIFDDIPGWNEEEDDEEEMKREESFQQVHNGSFKSRLERSKKLKGKVKMEVHEVYASILGLNKNMDAGEDEEVYTPPIPKKTRQFIHALCNKYGMRTETLGRGAHLYMRVWRTQRTRPIDEEDKLVGLLLNSLEVVKDRKQKKSQRQPNQRGQQPEEGRVYRSDKKKRGKDKWKEKMGRAQGKKQRRASKNKDESSGGMPPGPPKLKHGHVVGGDANPIEHSNRGHQMLLKMGWSTGRSLGSTSVDTAIKEPIEAVFRAKKVGLGFDSSST